MMGWIGKGGPRGANKSIKILDEPDRQYGEWRYHIAVRNSGCWNGGGEQR